MRIRQFSLVNGNSQNAFYQAASMPFALSAIDPANFNNPLTRQVSFSVERQIGRNISAEIAYIGNYIANLPRRPTAGSTMSGFARLPRQGI